MKRLIAGVLMVVLLVLPTTSTSFEFEKEVKLYEEYHRPYQDANKAWDGTDNPLCWLASIANMVGFIHNVDAQELYDYMRQYAPNDGANIYQGLLWVGRFLAGDMHARPESIGLLQNADFAFADGSEYLLSWILSALMQHEVVSFTVLHPLMGVGHAITVYGYEVADNGAVYLYYTDSDDNNPGWKEYDPDGYYPDNRYIRKMFAMNFRGWDGSYSLMLGDHYAGWQVVAAVSLPMWPNNLISLAHLYDIPDDFYEWTEEEL